MNFNSTAFRSILTVIVCELIVKITAKIKLLKSVTFVNYGEANDSHFIAIITND